MNDCAQRCLGGAALRQAFQNVLDVAHSVRVIDVLHGGERFVVGNGGLNRRKLHKASLESIERNYVIGGKHSFLFFNDTATTEIYTLRNTFLQPLRATPV